MKEKTGFIMVKRPPKTPCGVRSSLQGLMMLVSALKSAKPHRKQGTGALKNLRRQQQKVYKSLCLQLKCSLSDLLFLK